jgi:hypothetical protein
MVSQVGAAAGTGERVVLFPEDDEELLPRARFDGGRVRRRSALASRHEDT